MFNPLKYHLTLTNLPYFNIIEVSMSQVITITSKRQLTIPAKLFKSIGLSTGDKLIIEEKKGSLHLTPAKSLVDTLAGSVTVPSKLKQVDPDTAIKIAKRRHFEKKV